MLKTVRRLFFDDEFNRNVLTLMTGTGLAQIIPLAVTPILTRIYSPEQFGVFALFIAVTQSLSVMATGRYEMAIMLPRKDTDAANVTALAIAINFGVSVLLLAVAWLFNEPISQALGNQAISPWLYFVPLAIMLNGTYLSLNYWSNRNKLYVLMANRRVIHSGGIAAAQLGFEPLSPGAGGLVLGSISGQALAAGMMVKMVHRRDPRLWRCIDHKRMWALAKRYKNCVRFLVPAHTLGALATQIPAIFMNAIFGLTASGFFMLAERIVGMPLSLLSVSIADVFRQQISQSYQAGKGCRREFLSALKKLILIAVPPFVALLFFAPDLFAMVFGDKWRIAGEYAQLMCPMFFLRFIANPLSVVVIIAQRNRYELLLQLGMLSFLVFGALSHYVVPLDARDFIVLCTIVCSAFDLIYLFVGYKLACNGDLQRKSGAFA